MKAQKCPVCGGRGYVDADFYPDTQGGTSKYVKCRTCNGTGIVYVPEQDYMEMPEEPEPEKKEEKEEEKYPEDISMSHTLD